MRFSSKRTCIKKPIPSKKGKALKGIDVSDSASRRDVEAIWNSLNLLFSASKKEFSVSKSTFAAKSTKLAKAAAGCFEDRGCLISILFIKFF